MQIRIICWPFHGQMALERRMETIAHNVANASTAGFRAEAVTFETVLSSQTAPEAVSFSSAGGSYLSRQSGGIVRTDNPFDVAVKGDAWLAIDVSGTLVYTRDGRMRMTETGELQSLNGNPVLDASGAPIQLDPRGGTPQIAQDGTIWQNTRQIGSIGLYRIDESAKLMRAENSGVIPDKTPEPALDFANVGVVQGFIEQANVNPVMEMTRLIAVHRAFNAITNSITTSETTMQEAIKTLGGS